MSNITQHVSVDTLFGNISMSSSDGNLTCGQFLDAMKEKLSDVGIAAVLEAVSEYDNVKKKNEEMDEKIKELAELENSDEDMFDEDLVCEEIDCGIGLIKYVEPNNILLQQIMERFAELFETKTPLEISKLLNDL